MSNPEPFPPQGRPPTPGDLETAIVRTAAAAVEGTPPAEVTVPVAVPVVRAGRRPTPEEVSAFLADVEIVDETGRKAKVPLWQKEACVHCGGLHLRACPRVKRFEFGPGGTLTVVEFWAAGEWPADLVVWPEDILEAIPAESTGEDP